MREVRQLRRATLPAFLARWRGGRPWTTGEPHGKSKGKRGAGNAHDAGSVWTTDAGVEYRNVYWAFDAGNQQLVRFDFQSDHGPGSMDHSIASVRRYVEVELETTEEASQQAGVHAGEYFTVGLLTCHSVFI